jgi:hypothetical protein
VSKVPSPYIFTTADSQVAALVQERVEAELANTALTGPKPKKKVGGARLVYLAYLTHVNILLPRRLQYMHIILMYSQTPGIFWRTEYAG